MKTAIKWILGLLAFVGWGIHAVIADRECIPQMIALVVIFGAMVGLAKAVDRENIL